ncbi:cob(I)yrinic acid a,c-diamide adenosyltransferase [Bacteriovorax sp. Seq25_V]|uniref:cob(I)yrinic acid a,c-diamide adenosyltransferase n=1 Tax=Bacteriovorax sp. Seq25_V TaxID=1201288 RepID=UPI00038A3576|nr:cob(I)yrinic acid a,c-diamide adenosyltransferase [Bacteriovorax sp. Seq25_V]EQC43486.1 ATP:cob(I)alamin adenosyltransferase [Bacteriovorax sp. Seq25_V]
MKKAKVYTKTGDDGTTSLVGGERVQKSNARIHLYGDIDSLNSHVGLALSFKSAKQQHQAFDYLGELQSRLFDIGSNIACLAKERDKFQLPTISKSDITELESLIDQLEAQLPALKNFIMPGGCLMASQLHVCRTLARQIERNAVHFAADNVDEVPEVVLQFFNRLSDYFFVVARYANFQEGIAETIWQGKKSKS